ncbi:MAG: endo-1,4-beta-xylanase [Anaerolineae bacterium]|nr:endo-1,4-beta-xylanase [Thermoflexales bacterium]MDW8408846.1 endo-1,4-beta-xylanase [Anaerolineae bacterium]
MPNWLAEAQVRIESHRMADVALNLTGADGRPLSHAEVSLELTRHAFKLGANGFGIGAIPGADLRERYEERFAALLNYATLPFYWGGYEREPGRTDENRLEVMADWCARHGISAKGHPLVWHEVFPAWATTLDDADVLRRQQERVKRIVSYFKGRIDIWDVVNEATVSHTFDNPIGRWIAREGDVSCVAQALAWAREANPSATLLYNDFNISPAFERLCAGLIERGAPVDVIGIQSHMHKGRWPIERAWTVCETYARFGLPLHFTELTVLSGRLKAADDNDWHRIHSDWHSTAEGEAAQLDYGSQLYTLLFSHPAVEAITWWDFSDFGAWQGAPSGLLRKDMTPKPLYDWLIDAFHRRWTTRATVVADQAGRASLRAFYGDYALTARLPSGDVVRGTGSIHLAGSTEITVALA